MIKLRLYYATNRNALGNNRWRPDAYGQRFSQDGMENLRFGEVTVDADSKKVTQFLNEKARKDSVEHSYYLWGPVNTDIRLSIDAVSFDDASRSRMLKGALQNVWQMT